MRNVLKLVLLILICTAGCPAYAQDNKEKALINVRQALVYEENGKITEAIPLLEEAMKLDSANINVPYELAVAYATVKEFPRAKTVLEPLLNRKDVFGLVYNLLGSVYDELGKPGLAISTYEKGLTLFPKTAELYLELGNMYLKKKDHTKALEYYEKGIQANPQFASNYFRAAKLFFNSNEPVWGLLYGEIFMNLEKNTDRTAEISKLIHATYVKHIRIPKDSGLQVRFSSNFFTGKETLKPSFIKFIYEPIVVRSLANEKTIDINSLCRMRKKFVENYIKGNYYQQYPNALFTYQYKILKAGHIDAYDHWILSQADKTGFDNWAQKNPKAWENFLAWFKKHEIPLDDNYKFYREQY
jgi:tetratricopeptide (TPR) repeat protein